MVRVVGSICVMGSACHAMVRVARVSILQVLAILQRERSVHGINAAGLVTGFRLFEVEASEKSCAFLIGQHGKASHGY